MTKMQYQFNYLIGKKQLFYEFHTELVKTIIGSVRNAKVIFQLMETLLIIRKNHNHNFLNLFDSIISIFLKVLFCAFLIKTVFFISFFLINSAFFSLI